MIAYRATIDVPRELVQYLGRLLAAERRARGTRRDTRALTCFYQALLVLVWFRKAEDLTLLAAGFGISRATAYRYRDEGVAVLAAQATDLHTGYAASPTTAGRTSSSTASCSTVTGSPKPPCRSGARPSTPGIPESTATSAPTFKPRAPE
ncbi:transposase family protein [Micromonospora sp. WMMA1363]|uniref:transposase family protein n=1 Tax=Micromonospora sp. WMMA1363 TaxID=3053985 RepID=UPI00259D1C6B|nr:transposase family protein [Micromonospora sp. WMMA1363]MDM4723471.1 transposase family protein [Micromonospora sp. WMMA1363]